MPISQRFRGFLPVVIDLETGGFNSATDALLEIGTRGSWRLATEYDPHVELIRQANLRTDVNWIDPDDDQAASTRSQASSWLEKLGELQPIDSSARLRSIKSLAINTRYRAIGWLDQDKVGWRVRSNDLPDAAKLWVRFENGASAETVPVANVSKGEVNFLPDGGAAMRVGRPVWIAESNVEQPESDR